MARKWLILTALTMEARAIAQLFDADLAPVGQMTGLPSARLAVIGIGGSRLGGVSPHGFDAVMLAGLAGALDPALKIGDIITARDNISSRIHTATVVISTPQEKAELFGRTSAAAVDMESAVVESWARPTGLPLLVIRAISDRAQDVLPVELADCVNDIGEVRSAKLARKLAFRPSLFPKLVRLKRDSILALDRLAQAVKKELDRT